MGNDNTMNHMPAAKHIQITNEHNNTMLYI